MFSDSINETNPEYYSIIVQDEKSVDLQFMLTRSQINANFSLALHVSMLTRVFVLRVYLSVSSSLCLSVFL